MNILSIEHPERNSYGKRIGLLCRALVLFLISILVLIAVPSKASAETSSAKPKKSTWILELKWVASAVGGQSEVTGTVIFNVPKGGGPVNAEGPMSLSGSRGESGKGVMVIKGKVSKKYELTFVPDEKYMTITWAGGTSDLEVFETNDEVVLPLTDGTEITRTQSGTWGSTEITWRLKGSEHWIITVDSRQTVFPRNTSFFPRGHDAGLIVQWRLVLEFYVEGGEYASGAGNISLVGKKGTYSKPSGLYKAVYLKHRIWKDYFKPPGNKAGPWLTLRFPEPNYLEVLYRLERKKPKSSWRIEGKKLRLPAQATFRLAEGRREYMHHSGYLRENDTSENLVRGKPKRDFWNKNPASAHVVVVAKRIR